MDINNELNEFFSLIKQAKQQKKEEIEAQEKEYRDLVGDLSLESVLSEFSAHLKGEDKPKKEVQEVKEERQIQEIDSWLTPQVESSDVKDIVNSIISNNKKPVITENKDNDDVIDRALQILEKVTTKEEVQTNTTNPEISRIRRELENLKNIVAAQGGGGEVNLKYLDDTSLTSVANHDVLVYNDSTEKWENEVGVQRLILDVRNNTGSTLAAGTPVYQTGYNSGQDRITIAVADANVPSTMPAKGVVCDPIANNTNGFIVVYGEQEGVDTSAFNVADELYVAPGAGLTNVRPTGSGELVQKIAVVLKKSAGNGAILVYGAGRTNDVPNEISISGIITASALSVSGNISCAGTITYNDVTNVDSLGIGTFRSGVVVNTGTATTALIVNGDARITGILTIGTSSLTLNGTDDSIQVGTGLTIRDTGDAVYSGVITATTFNGNLTGNVTGNVTGNADTATTATTATNAQGLTGTPNIVVGVTTASDLTVSKDDTFNQDSSGQLVLRGNSDVNKVLRLGFDTTDNYGYLQSIQVGTSARSLVLQPWAGNVGIGTDGPGYRLDIQAADTTANLGYAMRLRENPTAGAATLQFTDSGVTVERGYIACASGNLNLVASSSMSFATNGSTPDVTIDSSGNLGVGSAAPSVKLDVNGQIKANNDILCADATATRGRVYADSTGLVVRADSGLALRLHADTGEKARIDSSGRLLVGTSSSINNECILQTAGGDSIRDWAIKYTGTSGGAETGFRFLDKNNAVNAQISNNLQNDGVGSAAAHLVFKTSTGGSLSERMRIISGGYTKHTSNGTYHDAGRNIHEFRSTENGDWILYLTHTQASPYGINIYYNSANPNNTTNAFISAESTGGLQFQVRSNGGIANFQGNDANLCDEREKKNIEALDSTWSCLKNWELKKFHYNDDADTDDKRYGVIAQQVAEHCPEVITDWIKQEAKDAVLDEDGNVTTPAQEEIVRMGVKEQQMMWMAIKALQEAQTRIEELEAKVAALENN